MVEHVLHFAFVARLGVTYTVQFRDAMSSDSWQKLTDISSLIKNGLVEVTDAIPVEMSARFYRIVSPSQP